MLPKHWTAVIHSRYLAQLPAAVLHRSSTLLPVSPLQPGFASLTSSAARAAAAVQPNSVHVQPHALTKHPCGLSLQCDLMQQGTLTALTELVAGTARTQTCLNRIQQLMKQQQQQLHRQLLRQQQSRAGQNTRAGQSTRTALKQQPGAEQAAGTGLDSAGQAAGAGLDSETGRDTRAGQDTRAEQDSTAGQQTRAGQEQLAWHVPSSAVVHLKQIGLASVALDVRPPLPWNSRLSQVWCHMLAFIKAKVN